MRESAFQRDVVRRIEQEFPGALVIRTDPSVLQGIPDLLILFGYRWAMLEVKRSATEPVQPNQDYYVKYFNEMSYASFVYPENEDKVFDELQHALRPRR